MKINMKSLSDRYQTTIFSDFPIQLQNSLWCYFKKLLLFNCSTTKAHQDAMAPNFFEILLKTI